MIQFNIKKNKYSKSNLEIIWCWDDSYKIRNQVEFWIEKLKNKKPRGIKETIKELEFLRHICEHKELINLKG